MSADNLEGTLGTRLSDVRACGVRLVTVMLWPATTLSEVTRPEQSERTKETRARSARHVDDGSGSGPLSGAGHCGRAAYYIYTFHHVMTVI